MARIRTIKPRFWDDIKIGKISRDARLLYIGLWTFADDLGVVISDPVWLKSKLFPYDPVQLQQFDKWVDELLQHGFISLLSYKQDGFYYLPNFQRHQVINKPNMEDVNIAREVLYTLLAPVETQSGTVPGHLPEPSLPIRGEEKERNTSIPPGEKQALFPTDAVEVELPACHERLAADQLWHEAVCMNHHISVEQFMQQLQAFFKKLQNEGVHRKSPRDAREHFARWLAICLSKKGKEKKYKSNFTNHDNHKEYTAF